MIGKSKIIYIFILIAFNLITIEAISAQGGIKVNEYTAGRRKYKIFYNQKLNWGNAFVACKAENADLVTFDSLSELADIGQFLEKSGIPNVKGEYFWTSGSDIYNEGHHIWMSNGREILKTMWDEPGQPDNANTNEHCTELWYQKGSFILNDRPCAYLNNFICETKY